MSELLGAVTAGKTAWNATDVCGDIMPGTGIRELKEFRENDSRAGIDAGVPSNEDSIPTLI